MLLCMGRGSLLYFLGCSLDPPTFASAIKCHQKSTSNSAGSSVGSLAPPRATPRLGGVYVSCQYFPCSFVLALRELGLRLGVKAQLPLRASSRGVLPGAPNALSVFISNLSSWLTKAAAASSLQNEIETIVVPRGLRRVAKSCPRRQPSHGSDRIGVLRTPSTARIARGKSSRFHTVSQITIHLAVTHCRVLFTIHQFSDDKYPKWAYLDSRAACHLGTCVTWLPMPYPKITSARVSQARSWQGVLS